MTLNILVVLVMFVPFIFSLCYKHSTLLTKIMLFIWCTICTVMQIVNMSVAEYISQTYLLADLWKIKLAMLLWGIICYAVGIPVSITDSPRYKKPK